MDEYDVVVIGGGPAGLQAALTLARVHREVLMVDSGAYRNDPAAQMHNVITHDGTPPAE
jgi:flavin-dependent dehydrogenase